MPKRGQATFSVSRKKRSLLPGAGKSSLTPFLLADRRWEELALAVRKGTLVILPVGQVEEHGLHLPVKTDAVIAERLALAVAGSLAGRVPVLVAPTVWSGYSTREVMRWPGCLNLRVETFMELVRDIVSSLTAMGFRKVAVLNAHGNHPGPLEVVARRVADEHGVYIAVMDPLKMAKDEISRIVERGPKGTCHACEFETSLMLALEPDLVRMDRAVDTDSLRIPPGLKPPGVFLSTWGIQRSATGAYGEPTAATREKGERILAAMTAACAAFLVEYHRLREPAAAAKKPRTRRAKGSA